MKLFNRQGRALLLLTAVLSVWAWAQNTAKVPIKVNVNAAVSAVPDGASGFETVNINVTANVTDTLRLPVRATDGVIYFGAQRHANAPAIISNRGGNITVNLPAQSYKSAEVSLYTVNGKRIMHNNVSSSNAVNNISRWNLATGVYLLSVRGANSEAVTARLSHSGGGLSINVAFADASGNIADARKMSKQTADWRVLQWTVIVSTAGYKDSVFMIQPVTGNNTLQNITLREETVSPPDHVHDWGDWVVTTPATCAAAGVETRTCRLDASHKETRAVAQLTGASCNSGGGSSETVSLGGVKWMKKNLNVETADSWCYLNSPDSCAKYGRLYTWAAAKTACQSVGMRLPTRAEWDNLAESVGGTKSSSYGTYHDWYGAGTKLKSTSGWYNNGNGTDQYGFSALPGGYRYSDGTFYDAGHDGYWWSSEEGGSGRAYLRNMHYYGDYVYEVNSGKSYGLSVRCVED